jgi:hypothetical protein
MNLLWQIIQSRDTCDTFPIDVPIVRFRAESVSVAQILGIDARTRGFDWTSKNVAAPVLLQARCPR